MDSTALRSIKNIVKGTIWRAELESGLYKKFYQYCIDGYRHLRLNHVKQGRKLAKFSVDQDLLTVDYNDDVIKIIDVGVPYNGEIWSLSTKNKMNITTSQSGGSEIFDTDINEGDDINLNSYSGYQVTGGVNIEGYYYDDKNNRRIMLRNFTGTMVWVYYVTSGVSLTGDTYIPVLYESTLMAYILKEHYCFKADANPNLYLKYKQMYDENLSYLRKAERASIKEIWDAISESTNPLAKR